MARFAGFQSSHSAGGLAAGSCRALAGIGGKTAGATGLLLLITAALSAPAQEVSQSGLELKAARPMIAQGSGVTTSDVNGLLKQFKMVQQMMKGVGKGKMRLPKELADMDLSQLQP